MAEKLKSPRLATVIMAIMIALAVILGSGRSLRALRADVEEIFWNGVSGDGIGVASDLSRNRDDAYNLLSVARGYAVDSALLSALENAVADFDAAGSDIEALFDANTALTGAVTDLYEAMGRQSLSDRDESYRQSLYYNILARNDTMSRDGYNTAALEFNQLLDRFPASLLRRFTSVSPASPCPQSVRGYNPRSSRNIPQGFQAGCTAMIFRLLLLDRLIIAGQKLLFFTELFICLLALLSQCMNSTGDRFIFFFYFFDCLCLLRLLTAQTQCLLRHTGFINLRLLQHRRKPLHPCFDRCTVIQDLYDSTLSLCHRLIQPGDLLLHRIQSLCSCLFFRIRLIQLLLPVTAF